MSLHGQCHHPVSTVYIRVHSLHRACRSVGFGKCIMAPFIFKLPVKHCKYQVVDGRDGGHCYSTHVQCQAVYAAPYVISQ